MLHPSGYGAARPVDVPIYLGADRPKGTAVAEEVGTVLDDGEAADAPRVLETSERDRAALAAGTASLIPGFTLTGSPEEVRQRVDAFAAMGVTEIAYQPAGPDISRELEAFAGAVMGAASSRRRR